MAARSWVGSSGTAIGIAAGAGAAQLGFGYGLGIVAWLPAADQAGKVSWLASLAWVVWIAASSTVIGAITAHRLFGRGAPGEHEGLPLPVWRATLALAAAVGALVTAPLVAVPARAAVSPQNFAPQWMAAGYAVVGVIVGLLVAVAALTARPIAANVVASMSYLWFLAVLAVIAGLRAGDEPVLAQLAIWEFSQGPRVRDFYVPGVLLMLAVAFAIGLLAAWRAGRRGDNRIGVAVSGGSGPLLVAAAYLLAAPQFAGEDTVDISQWSAYLFAPYAVIAGLAGSVLVAGIGQKETAEEREARLARAAERRAAREAARAGRAAPAEEGIPAQAAPPDDDDLQDWPSTLGRVSVAKPPVAGQPVTGQPGDGQPVTGHPGDESSQPGGHLADDGYAPARAYRTRGVDPDAKAYASDTVEAEPVTSGAGSPGSAEPATGRAEVRTPLWPDGGSPDGSPGRGRPRR